MVIITNLAANTTHCLSNLITKHYIVAVALG